MIQIDVKTVCEETNVARCNLYAGGRCVKIIMSKSDYDNLVRDGFFIRDGKELDSANVLNTTEAYELPKSLVKS